MKERLTITLDSNLYLDVKNRADELNESVSRIIENAVKSWRQNEIEKKLKQYYLNIPKETCKIVENAELMIDEI